MAALDAKPIISRILAMRIRQLLASVHVINIYGFSVSHSVRGDTLCGRSGHKHEETGPLLWSG